MPVFEKNENDDLILVGGDTEEVQTYESPEALETPASSIATEPYEEPKVDKDSVDESDPNYLPAPKRKVKGDYVIEDYTQAINPDEKDTKKVAADKNDVEK